MKTLNKIFEYKDYKFNIKVELNFSAERRPGGLVLHKITLNDMGISNFYKTLPVATSEIERIIELLENVAKEWVDERLGLGLSEIEIKLGQLGFK